MARIYKLSENWLNSAGIALLFLSVVMIPSNRALGAGNNTCSQQVCNNGCKVTDDGLNCTGTGCTKAQGCSTSCPCAGCWPDMSHSHPCQCHCCGVTVNRCVNNNTNCPAGTCD
jgi:hypothetical protein